MRVLTQCRRQSRARCHHCALGVDQRPPDGGADAPSSLLVARCFVEGQRRRSREPTRSRVRSSARKRRALSFFAVAAGSGGCFDKQWPVPGACRTRLTQRQSRVPVTGQIVRSVRAPREASRNSASSGRRERGKVRRVACHLRRAPRLRLPRFAARKPARPRLGQTGRSVRAPREPSRRPTSSGQ